MRCSLFTASAISVAIRIIGSTACIAIRIIGSIVRVTICIIGSIARNTQFVVDGDHIFHEKERQHYAFEDQTHDEWTEEHEQETVTTHPVRVAEVVGVRAKQHEETADDYKGGVEYIQTLIDFFGDKRPEVENVMHDAPCAIQLRLLFLGDDEDESRDDSHKGQYTCDHRKCFR